MKYLNLLIIFFISLMLFSCGPSGSDRSERAMADSIYAADSIAAVMDSVTMTPATINPNRILASVMPDSVVAEMQSNKIGQVTHLIKDTMKYNVADTVELAISYNCPTSVVVGSVGTFSHAQPSNITSQPTRLTPVMKARLIDPTKKNFIIVPITDTVQIVEMIDSTYTLWQWRVTPITGGYKELVLNVDMVVGNHTKSLKIYQDKIYVYVSPMTKFWNWVKLNWIYITGFVTLIVGIFTLREKITGLFRRKNNG